MSTLNDLEADVRNLHHLIDTLCDQTFNGYADKQRCDALLWIARDCAVKCKDAAHQMLELGDGQSGGKP